MGELLSDPSDKWIKSRIGHLHKKQDGTLQIVDKRHSSAWNELPGFIVGATKLTHESQRGTFPGGSGEICHTYCQAGVIALASN